MNINPQKSKYFGESMLFVVTIFWSATFVIVKQSLDDISSMLFIASRFCIALIILLPFAFKYRKEFSTDSMKAGFILGVILFFSFASQTVGLKYTTATKSGFITGSAVVMIPILQTIIERRIPTKGSIIGILIVFFGIILLTGKGDSLFTIINELFQNISKGDVLTLFCAFAYSFYVIYLDMFSVKYNQNVLLIMQVFVTCILAVFATLIFAGTNLEPLKFSVSNNLIFGIVYTSIFATVLTTALQTKYQNCVTPSKAAIIYSFEPLFAAVLAFFVLSEKISNFGLLGCFLIFFGLLFSEFYDNHFLKYEKKKN